MRPDLTISQQECHSTLHRIQIVNKFGIVDNKGLLENHTPLGRHHRTIYSLHNWTSLVISRRQVYVQFNLQPGINSVTNT